MISVRGSPGEVSVLVATRTPSLALAATLVFSTTAKAHDPGISTAMGEVRADTIAITTGFAPADVQQLLPKELRTAGQWTEGDFVAARDALRTIAPRLWEARSGEAVLAPRETRVELAAG